MATLNTGMAAVSRTLAHLSRGQALTGSQLAARSLSTSQRRQEKEFAVEMACSNIRYGPGVTKEVGLDCRNLGAKNVCVMTDPYIAKLPALQQTVESLEHAGVKFSVYDKVRVEPSQASFEDSVAFCIENQFDAYVCVGGGSVMDTCKAANLYASNPSADFLDYVNAPIGKGLPVKHILKPLIAIPTTAGTGSETTGTAVFDLKGMSCKTGITSRAMKPTLGLLDPLHLSSCPERVTAYAGIDVLTHALESFTALPYTDRQGQADPSLRPGYQGSNPISDIWSLHALRQTAKFIKRAVYNADDTEARAAMLLASCSAGIGFGNAGCHLCHALSYPISGQVKSFVSQGYGDDHPLVPHGLSVVITAPAVFRFTSQACPDRHLAAAEALGYDIRNAKQSDAGRILSDVLAKLMYDVEVPDGIGALGYTSEDIPELVEGALPQHRLTKLSPRPASGDDLAQILSESIKNY